MRFPPSNENTYKSQSYSVEILEISLLFCEKPSWKCSKSLLLTVRKRERAGERKRKKASCWEKLSDEFRMCQNRPVCCWDWWYSTNGQFLPVFWNRKCSCFLSDIQWAAVMSSQVGVAPCFCLPNLIHPCCQPLTQDGFLWIAEWEVTSKETAAAAATEANVDVAARAASSSFTQWWQNDKNAAQLLFRPNGRLQLLLGYFHVLRTSVPPAASVLCPPVIFWLSDSAIQTLPALLRQTEHFLKPADTVRTPDWHARLEKIK